jgi:stage II sporulation protein D
MHHFFSSSKINSKLKNNKTKQITKEIISPDRIKVYNVKNDTIFEINFEDYIIGVLSGEMPASYELEALKAQAVAIRSYVLDKIINFNKQNYLCKHNGAHICTDPGHCEAYLSQEDANNKWGKDWTKKYFDKIMQAVLETKSEYMICEGEVVKAFFFALSGGGTEFASDIWGGKNYPYLKPVQSKFDKNSPNFLSEKKLSVNDFKKKLKLLRPEIKELCDSKISLNNIKKTTYGSVREITFNNENFKGEEIRNTFNLRSTNFEITINDDCITFLVKGHGHGVGMSQYGANYLAKNGKNYKEILRYYYNGISFSHLN